MQFGGDVNLEGRRFIDEDRSAARDDGAIDDWAVAPESCILCRSSCRSDASGNNVEDGEEEEGPGVDRNIFLSMPMFMFLLLLSPYRFGPPVLSTI